MLHFDLEISAFLDHIFYWSVKKARREQEEEGLELHIFKQAIMRSGIKRVDTGCPVGQKEEGRAKA